MNNDEKTIFTHINIIKIIACFLVIINHTVNHVLLYETKGVNFFFCFLFSLCKIAVPLFIICSGYLLLKKDYSYKKILQNIFKILVPLLVISFLLYVKDTGFKNINILEFFTKFLAEPYIKPYWYLYMLPGLYLITPFMQKMIKNFDKKDYYLFCLFFLIIPSVLKILLVCFDIKYSSYILISFVPYTLGYFVFGSLIEKNYKDININIVRLVFFISFISMFLLTFIPSINGGSISFKFDDVSSLPVILMSLSLSYIFNYKYRDINYSKKSYNIINTIASTTFGIYLFHDLIGYKIITNNFVKNIFSINVSIAYLLCVVIIFIICGGLTFLLKQIPIVKRFL